MVDDGAFVIGCEGILTEEETLHSLKVCCCLPLLLQFIFYLTISSGGCPA